jgi:nitrate/TMAO reductase-like tetraheme cytochrome c subunit
MLFCCALPFYSGFSLPEISEISLDCIDCHKQDDPSIYEHWTNSVHAKENIGCFECHGAERRSPGSFLHNREWIKTVVSPRDCARCHEKEVEQFSRSRHAKAFDLLGDKQTELAETMQGGKTFRTPAFRQGVSPAAVSGCQSCHGSEIKMNRDTPDSATWPNTGIGRINPDGSRGACSACHGRHSFSKAQAREPESCARCHSGPDHSQFEIYQESKHGAFFRHERENMQLTNAKWILGEDYHAAPNCATCHISANTKDEVTHDIGERISWNNRGTVSIKSDAADAERGFENPLRWQRRKANMQKLCQHCHNSNFVRSFYEQYDAMVELYNDKYGKPGERLYELAKPLFTGPEFANRLSFIWYEMTNFAGRRARHGAAMMGPVHTHWLGTYELGKKWATEFIPEITRLIESKKSSMPEQTQALEQELERVMSNELHKWMKP